MRRISDFQINSPRLDGVVQEIGDARGEYPTLKERLDSILSDYKIKSVYPSGDSLIVEINPGLAFIDDVPVLAHSVLTCHIYQPQPQTVYYIYLKKDGTLIAAVQALQDADSLLLGAVTTGQTTADVTVSDLRPFLQKGGATGEVYDARGGYDTLSERLQAMEGEIDAVSEGYGPIGDRLTVVESEVSEARGNHASLDQRLDSLDDVINGFTFSETHVSTENQQTFTLQHRYPVGQKKLRVFVGGVLMEEGSDADYIETDAYTVTFNYPLSAGQNVRFVCENLVPGMGFTETFTATPGQTLFNLSYPYPVSQNRLRVYVNGVLYEPGPDNDYTETSEYAVTFNYPLTDGDRVKFIMESTTAAESSAAGGYTSIAHRLNSQLGDCNVDISIEYDGQNRVVREIWTGDVNKTIEYTYNEQGYRASEVVTEGNLIITTTYTYNASGLITGISVRKRLLA